MSLEANNCLYELLLAEVARLARQDDARLLPLVEKVANAAWYFHPGRFADGALENVPFRVGMRLAGPDFRPSAKAAIAGVSTSRTLHVATSIHAVGGHSRVLTRWVQKDLISSPAIVLTRQTHPVPEFLRQTWDARGATVTQLRPQDSIETRAYQLRLATAGCDRVILHTNPDDAVPVVAYARPGGCPVAMFNHAHFWFSLGSTVSDIIINTVPYFQSISQRHRFARETALLIGSGGLQPLKRGPIDKLAAKKSLGLAETNPVAIAIAQEDYFRPAEGYDFFGTIRKLMELRHDLHLLLVGVCPDSVLVPRELRTNARVRLLGFVSDPTAYYRAADLCLESFPMPSLGAVTESIAYGEAFPVPVYGIGENVVRVDRMPMYSFEFRPADEGEYLAYICKLLDSREETRAKAVILRERLVEVYDRFANQFGPLYQQIDALEHRPGSIPATNCSAEEDNRILALLATSDVGTQINSRLPFIRAALTHIRLARRGHESKKLAARRIVGSFLSPLRRGRRPAAF